ncbi:allantoate deiminase [Metabacillus niabensis]|uniref:Allantoate deiminase n=2 Tax=Metabacillus niabensis TaxID=324854 RepID=A0ABT9Z1J0_9BACI|nr:allantoate deiminase [Metabacillus niabensis]MDQ0226111.1 allantoate deiminase [Metabacillus niabensis]
MIIDETKTPTFFEQIEEMVEWLASFGKSEKNGVTRPLYSSSWQAAQQGLEKRMKQIGLEVYYDDVGNLFGRLPAYTKSNTTILTGSHIDTVIDGGKYDGAYGIIAGIIALQYLYENYGQPKKNIEVVSLCEEEGSRFPMTYWGSGSITGVKTINDIEHLTDSQGISFVTAMQEAGFGKGNYQQPLRNDLECFVELHIEQGEMLEREGKSIGIVSHIVGQRRYNVTIIGESNHAGTTPMSWRKDAMYTAAELIQYVMKKAKETSPDLVATVGQMVIEPNLANVIPGEITFSLDIRHRDEHVLESFCQVIFEQFSLIASKHQTEVTVHNWMMEKPVKMSEKLNSISEALLMKENIPYKKMTSGAGHDSQRFGGYCPTSLLFVPSKNGVSHSPNEFTKTEDLEKGIQLLIKVLYKLAYEGGGFE